MGEAQRPRIALVTDAIPPYNRGGKEQRYEALIPRLARHGDVHVYTMNWWRGDPVRADGPVTYHAICPYLPLYAGGRRSIKQAAIFALSTLKLLREPFDVIEADSMPYLQLIPLKVVTLLRRRRLAVTWHESWGPAYWRDYLGRAGFVGWMFERLAMSLADVIIAASPQTGARLVALRAAGSVVVAPGGIDLDRIERSAPSAERVDVITVGRLLPHKRIDLLIEAIARLAARGRKLKVLVVGTGPEYERLVAAAETAGVREQFTFREDLTDQDELFSQIKAAGVAVYPSEREGFGIAVLEALACRVPVVVTSAPDNLAQALARQSRYGVVCAPDSRSLAGAIEAALATEPAPGADREDWIGEYDWDTISRRVEEALI